jgi:hypothetical protein
VNIELIVGEIDAEIKKLQRIRAILKKLLSPQPRTVAKPQPARVKRLPRIAVPPEPRLIVLPPKRRREYTRVAKPIVIAPKALAAPASNRPVFVPKAAVWESQPAKVAGHGSGLEAVMRRKLLGGAA